MRPVLLLDKEDMPMGSGLAVVFVERIIDLISAMVMAVLVLALADIPILEGSAIADIRSRSVWLLPILLAGLFVPIFATTFGLINQTWMPDKILGLINPFLHQLDTLRSTNQLSLGAPKQSSSGSFTAMYGLAAEAFGISGIGFLEGMGILAFTMIGMAAPVLQGLQEPMKPPMSVDWYFWFIDAGANFAPHSVFTGGFSSSSPSRLWIWMVVDGTSFGDLWKKLNAKRTSSEE